MFHFTIAIIFLISKYMPPCYFGMNMSINFKVLLLQNFVSWWQLQKYVLSFLFTRIIVIFKLWVSIDVTKKEIS